MAGNAVTDAVCGPGKKAIERGSPIPEIAQLYAYALFRNNFRTRFPAGATYHDWDIIQGNVAGGNSVIDLAAGQIQSDLRNYTSKSAKNLAKAKAGNFSGLREGRQLRGDGIGLAIDPIQRKIVCELLEVTTIDDAEDCIKGDLIPKLALLRGPVKALLDAKLAELRSNASFVPQEFIASGTPWIISPSLSIVPLFPNTGVGPPDVFRWICFAQTYIFRPYPIATSFVTTAEPDTSPARGLILYSYHEAQSGAIPVEVLKRFAAWVKNRLRSANDPFGLLPATDANRYWQENNDDLKRILAYLAIGVLAIGVIALSIYLAPILFPLEAAALASAGIGSSLALAARGAVLVEQFSVALPGTIMVAQTAVNAAINIGGGASNMQVVPAR